MQCYWMQNVFLCCVHLVFLLAIYALICHIQPANILGICLKSGVNTQLFIFVQYLCHLLLMLPFKASSRDAFLLNFQTQHLTIYFLANALL